MASKHKKMLIQYEGDTYEVVLHKPNRKTLRAMSKIMFGEEEETEEMMEEEALGTFVKSANGRPPEELDDVEQWVIWIHVQDFLSEPQGIRLNSQARVT